MKIHRKILDIVLVVILMAFFIVPAVEYWGNLSSAFLKSISVTSWIALILCGAYSADTWLNRERSHAILPLFFGMLVYIAGLLIMMVPTLLIVMTSVMIVGGEFPFWLSEMAYPLFHTISTNIFEYSFVFGFLARLIPISYIKNHNYSTQPETHEGDVYESTT